MENLVEKTKGSKHMKSMNLEDGGIESREMRVLNGTSK